MSNKIVSTRKATFSLGRNLALVCCTRGPRLKRVSSLRLFFFFNFWIIEIRQINVHSLHRRISVLNSWFLFINYVLKTEFYILGTEYGNLGLNIVNVFLLKVVIIMLIFETGVSLRNLIRDNFCQSVIVLRKSTYTE